jgi:hypothetical protein
MINKMTCILLLLLTLASCKKTSTVVNPDDKGPVESGGNNTPLSNVYLLGYQIQGLLNMGNMLYKDKNPTGVFRPYDTERLYGCGIHPKADGNTPESFNYYGIEYLSSNITRVVYLKKEVKEFLADKLNINLGANYDESILAREIYNGDLYLSIRALDFDAKLERNYCYKITRNGNMTVIPLTDDQYYGLEFISILPSGLISATVGSPYGDGRFRIYRGLTEIAAIDITTEDFKHSYVQGFRMINDNEAEMIIQSYQSTSQPARMYYATYNITTKTLNKYKSDFFYDDTTFRMEDCTYENGKFYIAASDTRLITACSIVVELDKNTKKVKATKNPLEKAAGATDANVVGIFVKNGTVFVTGSQGGKYSYWQKGEWVDPVFKGTRNDFITDILYLP